MIYLSRSLFYTRIMLRLVLLTILGTAVVSASVPADHHYIVIGTEQTRTTPNDEAETIINKAVQKLGGDR